MRFQWWICPVFATQASPHSLNHICSSSLSPIQTKIPHGTARLHPRASVQPRPSPPLVHARAPPPRSNASPGARAAAALGLERPHPPYAFPSALGPRWSSTRNLCGLAPVAAPSDSPRILSPRHGVAAAPLPATASPPRFPSTRRHHLFLNFPVEVTGLSSAPQDTRTRRPRHPQVLLQLDLTRILTLDLQYFTSRHMLDFVGNRFMMSGLFCFSTLFLPLYLLHQLEYSTKMFLLRYSYREHKKLPLDWRQDEGCRYRSREHKKLPFDWRQDEGCRVWSREHKKLPFDWRQDKGCRVWSRDIRSYLSIGGKTKGAEFGLGNIRSCLWIGGKTKGAGFGLDAITLFEPWRRRLYCVTMIRACPGQGKIESGREAKLESHGIWVHLIARDGRD